MAVLLSLDYASPASFDTPSELGVAKRGQHAAIDFSMLMKQTTS
jgi:hypothetical protein